MCRPADVNSWIAGAQQRNLIQIHILIGGRVDGDTMHDCEMNAAMLEEADQVVNIPKCQAPGREDHRFACVGDFLQSHIRRMGLRLI